MEWFLNDRTESGQQTFNLPNQKCISTNTGNSMSEGCLIKLNTFPLWLMDFVERASKWECYSQWFDEFVQSICHWLHGIDFKFLFRVTIHSLDILFPENSNFVKTFERLSQCFIEKHIDLSQLFNSHLIKEVTRIEVYAC